MEKTAIENSGYFLPLLSSNSVKAPRQLGLDFLDKISFYKRFILDKIIPARLDNCEIPVILKGLHYVDLFPDWTTGLNQIMKAMGVRNFSSL